MMGLKSELGFGLLDKCEMMSVDITSSIKGLDDQYANPNIPGHRLTISVLYLFTFIHGIQLLLGTPVHIIVSRPDNVFLHPKEDLVQLARSLREWLSPETVLLILHKLDEADQEPEWMRSLDDDSFEENTTDSVGYAVGLLSPGSDDKQVEHERDVEVGMSRGVSKLVGYNGKEVVLACTVSCRIISETK